MNTSLQGDSAATESLLVRAGEGDAAAFARLMERHLSPVREMVGRRLNPRLRARVDPSDVVQETQRDAFRRLADFVRRRPMPFGLWLLKTAHERLIDVERQHLQRAKRSVDRELSLPEESSLALASRLIASSPSPSDVASQRELARTLRRALARLPESDRNILLLRCFENLTNDEAAAVLEIKPEAAKKRFTRGLLHLRRLLREDGIDEAES